jgi:hypothetical protein
MLILAGSWPNPDPAEGSLSIGDRQVDCERDYDTAAACFIYSVIWSFAKGQLDD